MRKKRAYLRAHLLIAFFLLAAGPAAGQQVDFANFTYSLDCVEFEVPAQVTVQEGEFADPQKGYLVTVDTDGIVYADFTGDGFIEAAVTVHCGWFGANYTSAQVLVYTTSGGQLKQIARLGDDVFSQDYLRYYPDGDLWPEITVSADGNSLIIKKGEGGAHCCPEYDVTLSYAWDGQRFALTGEPGRTKSASAAENATESSTVDTAQNNTETGAETGLYYYYEAVETANMRGQPSADAVKVGTLRRGDRVFAEKSENKDWYQVYHDGNAIAYVYAPLLKPAEQLGKFPIGALGGAQSLTGSFWLSEGGHDSIGDSHLVMSLQGDAARVLYHTMKVAPEFNDPCSGWMKTKTSGAMICGTDDDRVFGCHFGINIGERTIDVPGMGC